LAQNPNPKNGVITYADAGVNIDRANRTKQRIKYLAHKTFTRGVLSEIGGFGGLFSIDKKYIDPVLVSSVDGVGTKLNVAFAMNVHHTVGGDLVNHCVNDIAVQGAAPLFFMDYLATGKLDPEIAEKVVEGIADACKHNGCALIGGETAEMPGFYPDGEYDLAGFIVGVVEREKIVTGKTVEMGDVVLGLPSTGLHTNGYSLARKLLFDVAKYSPETYVNEIKNKVGNELMRPHKSYWPILKKLVAGECVSAMAHVTGVTTWNSVGHRTWLVARAADLRSLANSRQRSSGRDATHLQHGYRYDPGHSRQKVQESGNVARSRRRKVL
jgi:phosphoribosylformylglycinamidine cyclo-ligase